MNRKALGALSAVPGVYSLLAFVTARRAVVRGRSMIPTLVPGERVLFDRLAYELRRPRRSEVVLAAHPARPGVRLIKRLAALPGDMIEIDRASRQLGPDQYWLLGDACAESTDSRQLGPVRRRDILARAWIAYWPPERFRTIGSRRGAS